MGTNFYVRGHRSSDDPETHVGLRSAAGAYCWDCGKTLCKGGNEDVHLGRAEWNLKCTFCGKELVTEKMDESTGGRELGYNKNLPGRKTGVKSCSSFTWAMTMEALVKAVAQVKTCPCCNQEFNNPEQVIEDEYGRLYTMADFMKVLEECPIQFNDAVGTVFS